MTAAGLGGADGGGFADRLKRGAAMTATGLVVTQVVMAVQMIVVGRLLGPEQVGVFTAGSAALWFLMTFAQGALPQALVQRERDVEDAANTVLVASFVTGLLTAILVLATSPIMGDLFHDSRVGRIAAATSGVIVLYACSSVPNGLMQRAFQFKQRMIIDPAAQIAFATVSIVFALSGFGAWALVIGLYASTTTGMVLSWWMAKWRPFRGRFSFKIWRELARFSMPLVLSAFADRAREMFQQLLVGRSLGTANLGQYRYGYRIAYLPAEAIYQACCYVMLPAFSRMADDRTRFRAAFVRALGWIWFAALPVGALLVVLGQPVVVLLLGEEWRPAGAVTAAMAGIGPGAALLSVSIDVIKGAGRTSLLNWITALTLGTGVGLVVLLLPFGLVGVGVGISLMYLVIGCLGVELARSVVSAPLRDVVSCLAPTTLSALLAFAVVFPLERLVVRSDQIIGPLGLLSLLGECLLFMLVYLCVLWLVSPTRYRRIRDMAHGAVSRIRDLTRRPV